jgi:hypothetical protein
MSCDTVQSCTWISIFRRSISIFRDELRCVMNRFDYISQVTRRWSLISMDRGKEVEAACSSETSVYDYKATWCYSPEDLNLNNQSPENLKT